MARTLFALVTAALLLLGPTISTATAAEKGSSGAARVNVNTASVAELDSLPGIGPSIAKRIVEHRKEHGSFEKVEDLLAVKGIGAKLLSKIRDRVTVSGAAKGGKGKKG